MDFGLRSAKNNRAEALDAGWCDITSLLLKRHGRYDFGLTIQGFFVPPLSHTSQHAARARPEILISDSSSLEDAEVFSRALHETATEHTMLPATGYDQTNINKQRNGFVAEANASFNLGFDVDAAAYIEDPLLEGTVEHTNTQFGIPDQNQFFSDFAPDSTSSYSEDLFGLRMNSRSTRTPSSKTSFTTFANTSPTISPQPAPQPSTRNRQSPFHSPYLLRPLLIQLLNSNRLTQALSMVATGAASAAQPSKEREIWDAIGRSIFPSKQTSIVGIPIVNGMGGMGSIDGIS